MIFKVISTAKTEVALPISVKYSFPKMGTWAVAVQLLCWLFLIGYESKPVNVEQPTQVTPSPMYRPSKSYADQRQKTKRNRRRRPKKAMANLYQLQ